MVVTKLNTNIILLRGNILYEMRCSLASGAVIWGKKKTFRFYFHITQGGTFTISSELLKLCYLLILTLTF